MTNILIIGATSAIAEHYARIHAARGNTLVLVGRSAERLDTIAHDLRTRGAPAVSCYVLDVADHAAHDGVLSDCWSGAPRIDTVLIAHGTLPDQERATADTEYAVSEFNINGLATIALMNRIGVRLQQQGGPSTLAVISSVAGDRGRASNYLYGSAKAAVSTFASGLRQRMRGTGINVLTIKPGFVDTPMTRAFRKGVLWASPASVANGIDKAVRSGASVAYLPIFWYGIMTIIRAIPEVIFRRIAL